MPEVAHLSSVDPVMARLIEAAGPYALQPELRCPPFQALARAITHQQLNGIAAKTILGRFVQLCGAGGFPKPEAVLAASDGDLRGAGLSFSKIAALRDLASKTIAGVVPDRRALSSLSDDEIVERLTSVRGIGRWTVEMMLMFQLGRADVLPVDDFGVRNGFRLTYGLRGMPHPRALAAFGAKWRPYRTAAAWYLWRAVDLARAGALPAPIGKTRLPRVVKARRKHALRKAASAGKAVSKRLPRPVRAGRKRLRPRRSRSPT